MHGVLLDESPDIKALNLHVSNDVKVFVVHLHILADSSISSSAH